MAEVKRHHCDICGKPRDKGELKPLSVAGHKDASRDEVCSGCRAKAASAIFQLFDRTELRRLGLEAPTRQAASSPQNDGGV